MAAADGPVVVDTYPARKHADELLALLREHGITAAVVPSNQLDGEWDVMVAGHDAARAKRLMDALLNPD
jgi:type III secretory pathway lipoprotein EscJ